MEGETAPTPSLPTLATNEAYNLNLKGIVEETIKDLAELRDKYEQQGVQVLTQSNQLALKTLQDAQSAANVHLLNVIDSADKLSKSTITHLATIAANEEEEQAEEADITMDDVAKLMESTTTVIVKALDSQATAMAGIAAAMQAIAANMATGRPPVNQSGTTGTPVAAATT